MISESYENELLHRISLKTIRKEGIGNMNQQKISGEMMTSYEISIVFENSWIESNKKPGKEKFFPKKKNMKEGTKILGK